MTVLTVKGMKKSFGNTEVLKGVDISLEKGEALAVVGASGNGKTTFLRCLTLLETPDEGVVCLGNEVVSFDADKKSVEAEKEKIRGKIGLVFQNFNLFPQYTALDNVKLPLDLAEKERKAKGLPPLCDDTTERALQLLAKMGLADKAGNYPCELSGGQQQRVAIARAIALSPDVLCFDEPTSALDPALSDEVANVLNSLKGEISMIIVTHDFAFAQKVADRAVSIRSGVALPIVLSARDEE